MPEINTYDPRFSALKKMQKNGKNASTMLQDNRNLILQLIRRHGEISRKQLAEDTGLQQATVTIIIQELLKQGLIRENGMIDGGSGRRVKSFSIVEALYVVSVRLTGAYIKIALFNINIQPLYVEKIFFKTDDVISEAISLIQQHLKIIEGMADKDRILCLVIGVEHRYQLIENDFSVWDEKRNEFCAIGKNVHDLTGYRVFTNRGINFSTYQLWDDYKAQNPGENDYTMLINIQLSYDLESAIFLNKEIIYGKNGMSGQLKVIPISRNSDKTYKDVITVPAILKRSMELLSEYPDSYIADFDCLNIRNVIEGYKKGDSLCKIVYGEVAYYVGYVIVQIINWMDPDVIFIADEVPDVPEFIESVRAEVEKYSDREKAQRVHSFVRERRTKNDPVLSGGAKYAFDLMISDIGIYN